MPVNINKILYKGTHTQLYIFKGKYASLKSSYLTDFKIGWSQS